jgi:hypothetical protein
MMNHSLSAGNVSVNDNVGGNSNTATSSGGKQPLWIDWCWNGGLLLAIIATGLWGYIWLCILQIVIYVRTRLGENMRTERKIHVVFTLYTIVILSPREKHIKTDQIVYAA